MFPKFYHNKCQFELLKKVHITLFANEDFR